MNYSRAAFALAATMFLSAFASAADQELVPFQALPKRPTAELKLPADSTGEFIVKFRNDMRARVSPNGDFRALTPQPVDDANAILARFGMKAVRAINHDDDALASIESRAAARSGKTQPDLAGMIRVTGPLANLEAAAKALNDLDTVEWIDFEREMYIGGDATMGFPIQQQRDIAARMRAERERNTLRFERPAESRGGADDARTLGLADDWADDWADPRADDLATGNDGMMEEAAGLNGCCLESLLCTDLDPVDCVLVGGTPLGRLCGADTACGACCTSSGCFDAVTTTVCVTDLGGVYGGDSSDCGGFCLPGACCLANGNCVDGVTMSECTDIPPAGQGGVFQGDGTTCDDVECDNECGTSTQSCFDAAAAASFDPITFVPYYSFPFCSDGDCCNLVCDFDPFCCDEDGRWDQFCATTANLLCVPHTPNWDPNAMPPGPEFACTIPPLPNDPACPQGPDRCAAVFNESCFEPHPFGGCSQRTCCNVVCLIDLSCCAGDWDILCTTLAQSNCTDRTGGVTGDYEELQGYLTAAPYPVPFMGNVLTYVPNFGGLPFFGYGGEGWGLFEPGEPFDDLNGDQYRQTNEVFYDWGRDGFEHTNDFGEGNGFWDPPAGLRGYAEQLLKEFHINGSGQGNLTRGRTTKIGIIEWGCYPDHEDLNHVKIERGQTIIEIPDIAFNDHGTACLSIVNAQDNGFGVIGIVPDAEGWFFPLTSVEEGPRFLTAWTSMMAEFDAGDVVSASYGPVPETLNTGETMWTIFRIASDLGITVCTSAGNSCFNLDGADDFGDSGAIVVGACSPGFPWYRLAFSNYCTAPPLDNSRGNMVHLKAWGANVASAGYGALPLPPDGDRNKSYTPYFNGTSAASPQIAGLAAALQGLAKQFYGIPISPEGIRLVMGAPGADPINPPPFFGGFPGDGGCSVDFDPDLGPNRIGVYTETIDASASLIGQVFGGFVDAPLLEDVVVVRGKNIRGNRFSVKGRDNVYLNYDAIFTRINDGPLSDFGLGSGVGGGIPIPEVHDIEYILSGDITDIVFVGESDIDVVNSLIIEMELVYPNVFNLMIVELYDHRREEFSFVNLVTDPSQAFAVEIDTGDLIFAHVADAASRFIKQNRIVGRMWTVGFPNFNQLGGGGIGGDDNYRMKVDLINIFVSEEFGEGLPGG